MNFEKALKKVKDIVWKWQFSEKREAFIQVITAAQKQIPKLAKVDVVSQYIEGREMPKLVPAELEYKLENEGKYLHGQYNSIG